MNGASSRNQRRQFLAGLRYLPAALVLCAGGWLSVALFQVLQDCQRRQAAFESVLRDRLPSGEPAMEPFAPCIAAPAAWQPWVALMAGLALSALVAAAAQRSGVVRQTVDQRTRQLYDSEQRYRSLVENIDMGIILIDPTRTIVAVNAAQCRLFGKSHEAFLGKKCYWEFEKRNSICAHCPGTQAMATGKAAKVETAGVRDDGSRFSVRINAFPLVTCDGASAGFIELVEDITKAKEAEEALHAREKQLTNIIANASETIYTISPDGVFTFVSPAWTQNLGHDVSAVLGHSFAEFIHPDDLPRCLYLLSRMREKGTPRETAEYRIRHKDGSWRWHRTAGSLIRDSQGNPMGFVGVANDVTERIEAQLQLAEAKQAAEAANRAKSEFLANMSHEIRTPLTAVLGYADLLLTTLANPDERQSAATIKRNGEHLLAVINGILDLSKIEAGKLEVERIACSPCQILAEVESLMSVNAEAKGLSLLLKYDGPLPESIASDAVRLRQILINLVGNAIKFTESGSVCVTARYLPDAAGEARLQFDVTDTGIGMTEEQVQRLFQPFAQADGSTTRRFGGTGLGLMISKRLATMLGGDITVRSALGQGSTFSATVATGPMAAVRLLEQPGQATPSASQSPPAAAPPIRLDCRILLAEDGFDNQRLISLLLRKAGADVAVAENGQEAVEKVLAAQAGNADAGQGRPFDVVLMDIQMPVMDGYQATRRLRNSGYRGPILALTAHALPQDIQQCLDVGCNSHLSKPIDRATLLGAVARFVAPACPALGNGRDEGELLAK